MMKPFTCVCLLSAAGSLLYLYQEKHAAQVVDREIGGLIKQSEQIREHTRLMQAQYQMLNDPERLAQLATQHLTLQQLAPAQYVKLSELGSRLPGPMAPASEPAAMDDAPETPTTVAAASPAPVRAPAAIVTAAVAPIVAPAAIAPMPAPVLAPVLAGVVAAAPQLPAHAAAPSAPASKPALMAAAPRAVVPVKAPVPLVLASRQVLQHHDEPAVTQVASQARPAYPAQTLNPPEPTRPAYVPPSNPQPYYAQSGYPRTTYAPSAYAQPVYAPSSYAPPGYPAIMPAIAAQRPQPPMVQNTGAGGSALGMARTPMAPPVPVSNAGSPYDR